jgi:hypothetical protein
VTSRTNEPQNAPNRPAGPKRAHRASQAVEAAQVQGWNAAYGALSLAFPGRLEVAL